MIISGLPSPTIGKLSRVAAVLLLVIVAFLWVYLVAPYNPIGKPIVVDSLDLGNGTKLTIVQVYTGILEPYKVSLLESRPDSVMNEYYLDHESLYWRGKLEFVEDRHRVDVYYYDTIRAFWDVRTLKFYRQTIDGFREFGPLSRGNIKPYL